MPLAQRIETIAATCDAEEQKAALGAKGTLILGLPCRDGLVVAADSRGSLGAPGEFVDNVTKLHVVSNTLLTITGHDEFRQKTPPGMTPSAWYPQAPVIVSGSAVARRHLEARPGWRVSATSVLALASEVASALQTGLRGAGARVAPMELSRIAVFEALDAKTYVLGSATIHVDARMHFTVAPQADILIYSVNDPRSVIAVGQDAYFTQQVYNPKQYPARSAALWDRTARFSDLGEAEAAMLTKDWIEAAAARARIVPPSSGIGGPVQGYLLTAQQVRPLHFSP